MTAKMRNMVLLGLLVVCLGIYLADYIPANKRYQESAREHLDASIEYGIGSWSSLSAFVDLEDAEAELKSTKSLGLKLAIGYAGAAIIVIGLTKKEG